MFKHIDVVDKETLDLFKVCLCLFNICHNITIVNHQLVSIGLYCARIELPHLLLSDVLKTKSQFNLNSQGMKAGT